VTVSVVIADDTPDIRRLLRALFEQETGIEVVAEAGDGLEAVEAARSTRPDAVLLDLAMPRMDGLEAIPAILEVSPASKVVVLSGFQAAAMAEKAMSRGAHAYLPKGTSGAVIAAKLREVCGVAEAPTRSGVTPAARTFADPTRVTATAVHELRNQVLVIEGFTRALRDTWDTLSEERRLDFFDRVLRNVSQMRQLVGTVGDLAQIEAHNLVLNPRPFSLGLLVEETVDDLGFAAGHPLTTQVEEEILVVADPVRIQQVVTNLLSNAVSFSPADEPILVKVRRDGGWAEITVTDAGPGVPPDRAPELFQPFAQLEADRSGSGLGLFISRQIMLAHGGSLELASSSGGACFAARLPVGET
jgi:signal transduction histidine kinase